MTKTERKQKQVPVWFVIISALGMLTYFGYLYQTVVNAPPPILKMTAEERKNRLRIMEIIERSQGDFEKITPEDKKWLIKLAGREEFARYAYKDVKDNPRPSWW